jgi:hypothetical protein
MWIEFIYTINFKIFDMVNEQNSGVTKKVIVDMIYDAMRANLFYCEPQSHSTNFQIVVNMITQKNL